MPLSNTKRVAVIGAGPAGLCTLRNISSSTDVEPTCFEMNSCEGGIWVYNEETGNDANGIPVHSGMYENLRTNIPKEVMPFSQDFLFNKSLPSFMDYLDVIKYLQDYVTQFDLRKYIKFNTVVTGVQPVKNYGKTSWEVTFSDVRKQDDTRTRTFDFVIVCNGHYAVPHNLKIQGVDEFCGKIIHSHDYRHASDFSGKTIVCIGTGQSGQDISVHVSECARKVYLSNNGSYLQTPLPGNVEQRPAVKLIKKTSVVFETDEEIEVDAVIVCIGYRYHFPFLSEDIGLNDNDGRYVWPLYKHIVHAAYPSLHFIGIPKDVAPFLSFHLQAQFSKAVIDGSVKLPTEEEMKKDIEDDIQQRKDEGQHLKYAHNLWAERQWKYYDDLREMAGIDEIPEALKKLYDHIQVTRKKNITYYKSKNYTLKDDGSFVEHDTTQSQEIEQ